MHARTRRQFLFDAGGGIGGLGLAALALVTTHTSAAAAAGSWVLVEWIHRGRPTMLGTSPSPFRL